MNSQPATMQLWNSLTNEQQLYLTQLQQLQQLQAIQ
eukprot:gene24876-10775_t